MYRLSINTVEQDGAGRIGKMIFARHGKKFDVDLKQVLLPALVSVEQFHIVRHVCAKQCSSYV